MYETANRFNVSSRPDIGRVRNNNKVFFDQKCRHECFQNSLTYKGHLNSMKRSFDLRQSSSAVRSSLKLVVPSNIKRGLAKHLANRAQVGRARTLSFHIYLK